MQNPLLIQTERRNPDDSLGSVRVRLVRSEDLGCDRIEDVTQAGQQEGRRPVRFDARVAVVGEFVAGFWAHVGPWVRGGVWGLPDLVHAFVDLVQIQAYN